MSATPFFPAAAPGRPFIFWPPPGPAPDTGLARKPPARTVSTTTASKSAHILAQTAAIPKLAHVVPASRLEVRPAPEMVSSGIPQLDALTGGFPRGCLTEISGAASSGRTSVLLSALASATRGGEICALVDASDAFDPATASAAGIIMSRLLWVRCGQNPPRAECQRGRREDHAARRAAESRLEQVLKVTDLLLQSSGFGMIALDLGDISIRSARKIPLASWFRFRRVVEHTPTVLLVLEQQPIAGSCSTLVLRATGAQKGTAVSRRSAGPAHAHLLDAREIEIELLRSRLESKSERKPAQSITSFSSRAAWAM